VTGMEEISNSGTVSVSITNESLKSGVTVFGL
jgi:hypothetical protein